MLKHKQQQEYKGTTRAMIYKIENTIGYIYITLHRKELEEVLGKSKIPLKHDGQINFKKIDDNLIELFEGCGGMPGGKIENDNYNSKLLQATKGEKIRTINKEVKEEMGLEVIQDYILLSTARDQNRKKETYEYKKFLEKYRLKQEERYNKHKVELDTQLEKKIDDDIEDNIKGNIEKYNNIPGLPTIGYGKNHDFNLEENKQRQHINANYQIAYDIGIDQEIIKSTETEAINEIGGFAKIPVHIIKQMTNGTILLTPYNPDYAKIFKYKEDRMAFYYLQGNREVKNDILEIMSGKNAIEKQKQKNKLMLS